MFLNYYFLYFLFQYQVNFNELILVKFNELILFSRPNSTIEDLNLLDSLLKNYDRRALPTSHLGKNLFLNILLSFIISQT